MSASEQRQRFTPSNHLTILDDSDLPSDPHTPMRNITNLIRHVRIGDRIFTITPNTVFKGIQADGSDYYPFYDDHLHDATDDDLATYPHDYNHYNSLVWGNGV